MYRSAYGSESMYRSGSGHGSTPAPFIYRLSDISSSEPLASARTLPVPPTIALPQHTEPLYRRTPIINQQAYWSHSGDAPGSASERSVAKGIRAYPGAACDASPCAGHLYIGPSYTRICGGKASHQGPRPSLRRHSSRSPVAGPSRSVSSEA